MHRPLIAALLVLLPTLAAAQPRPTPPLPAWDMRAHCERQNRILATESAWLDQEERAESLVRSQWDALPGAVLRTCLSQQQALRMASYFMLNACMEMEAGATRTLQQRAPRG